MKTFGAFIRDFTLPAGSTWREGMLAGGIFGIRALPVSLPKAKQKALLVTRPNNEKQLALDTAIYVKGERAV